MRILIVGAGGIGGYYGARILKAGGNVTFLVRPKRAAQLEANGLKVFSAFGDLQLQPSSITEPQLANCPPFDVVILSCKAYDLASVISAITPIVGEKTLVLPLLNGLAHLEVLDRHFGKARVLGGMALISTMLNTEGEIHHLNQAHRFVIGARVENNPTIAEKLPILSELLEKSGFDFSLSENITQTMWDKIVFLTSLAGATCLFRANIGIILKTESGANFINALFAECLEIARVSGYALAETAENASRKQLNDPTSSLAASMLRDLEKGAPIESAHIFGDMLARAKAQKVDTPFLALAYAHLQAYEIRQQLVS